MAKRTAKRREAARRDDPKSYGQFCPVAKAAEVFAERWTPLVLRELVVGSRRFSDLQRGVPLMSPSLLSRRLKELVDAGVVERRAGRGGPEYHLTEAGEELGPVIMGLGRWGQRWARSRVTAGDLDPNLLMWDVKRRVDRRRVPVERLVVEFELGGVPREHRRYWLVVSGDDDEVELCMKFPGYEVDLTVRADIRALVDVWMGYQPIREAVRAGRLVLEGPRALVRSFPDWFTLSPFAPDAQT